MPAVSLTERKIKHLQFLNSLSQVKKNRFQKGHIPWNKGTGKIVKRICQFCGKEFEIKESQAKRGRGKFCSKKCFYDAKKNFSLRKKVKELYLQGKTYKEIAEIVGRHPSAVAHYIYIQGLCDRFGDGITNSAHKYRIKRLLQINKCELCGYERATEVAHIIPRKEGGKYTLDNSVILCPNCHYLFDKNLLTEEERSKLLSIERIQNNLKKLWHLQ